MSIDIFRNRWYALRRRCNDKKFKDYPYYGWRGITFEWESFEYFYNDMYDSFIYHLSIHWKSNTTLERIDWNKNYSTINCKWATMSTQSRSRRNNRFFNVNNNVYSMMELSEFLWIPYINLRRHVTYFKPKRYSVAITDSNEFRLLRLLRKYQRKCIICDSEYYCLWLCENHYRKYYNNTRDSLIKLKWSLQKLNT